MRVCLADGCPLLVRAPARRCATHRQDVELARGSRQSRGYGAEHDRRRRELAPIVAAGAAMCARCGQPIAAGAMWDLGHDDNDRARYVGPEHAACNRATRGRS